MAPGAKETQAADLQVPRTCHGHETQVFLHYARRQRELDAGIGAMFIYGVFTTSGSAMMSCARMRGLSELYGS